MYKTNIIKKLFIIVIILSLLSAFNEYSNSAQNIDDLSYAVAIGVDIGETAKYRISLQLTTMESSATESAISDSSKSSSGGSSGSGQSSSGGEESSSKTSSNYIIQTMETDSIDSALNIANSYINKTINLSHCKILLVSEDIAKQGVEPLVNSLINKVETRPDCSIIVSKIPEGEFNDGKKPKIEELISKYYDVASNLETGRGYSETIKLNEFYLTLNDTFYQPYASLGTTYNTTKNTNEQNVTSNLDSQSKTLITNSEKQSVEVMGLAVFKKDKLVGTLNANQTLSHQLITNELDFSTLNIISPFNSNETLDIYISTYKKPKIEIYINNSSPFVKVNLYIAARIVSFNSYEINLLTEEKLNLVQRTVKNHLEKQIYDYLNTTAREYKSDISGLGRFAVKNFITTNNWNDYNWLENYQNSTFKVTVDTSIKTGNLLTQE